MHGGGGIVWMGRPERRLKRKGRAFLEEGLGRVEWARWIQNFGWSLRP